MVSATDICYEKFIYGLPDSVYKGNPAEAIGYQGAAYYENFG